MPSEKNKRRSPEVYQHIGGTAERQSAHARDFFNQLSGDFTYGRISPEEYLHGMRQVRDSSPHLYENFLNRNAEQNRAAYEAWEVAKRDYADDAWSKQGLDNIEGEFYVPMGDGYDTLNSGVYGDSWTNGNRPENVPLVRISGRAVSQDGIHGQISLPGILRHEGSHTIAGALDEESQVRRFDQLYNEKNQTGKTILDLKGNKVDINDWETFSEMMGMASVFNKRLENIPPEPVWASKMRNTYGVEGRPELDQLSISDKLEMLNSVSKDNWKRSLTPSKRGLERPVGHPMNPHWGQKLMSYLFD